MHKLINKKYIGNLVAFLLFFFLFQGSPTMADDSDFSMLENSFKNFVKCELTRTGATDHFKGKSFKITMIDLFDLQEESDLKIVTGAVDCFVETEHQTLYVAVGLKNILGRLVPEYYTIRKNDFSILATELIKYPYKERCKWSQYWIDID
ncbi:MAG: hypothetical protein ABIJ59_16345 [Pseudomonadota bacterium]